VKAPLLLRVILFAPAVFIASVLAFNWSGFRGLGAEGAPRLIAHRGVHQTFDADGVENDTCTAQRIHPPTHEFIENTIPSMRAAFDAGASVVELDVHLTPDGEFAVMHDLGARVPHGPQGRHAGHPDERPEDP
jgi:glycerophosphoryl diester phosphodiesterase